MATQQHEKKHGTQPSADAPPLILKEPIPTGRFPKNNTVESLGVGKQLKATNVRLASGATDIVEHSLIAAALEAELKPPATTSASASAGDSFSSTIEDMMVLDLSEIDTWSPARVANSAPRTVSTPPPRFRATQRRVPPKPTGPPGRDTFDVSDFAHLGLETKFQVVPSTDGLPPQNLLVVLQPNRGDEEPCVAFVKKLELPQTVALVIRAPLELPDDKGYAWYEEEEWEDNNYVRRPVPAAVPNDHRSICIVLLGRYLWSFLEVLHAKYAWAFERIFVLGFGEGAHIAFDMIMARMPPTTRLGGVVLTCGGIVAGPQFHEYKRQKSFVGLPALLLHSAYKETYPTKSVQHTRNVFYSKFRVSHQRKLFWITAGRFNHYDMLKPHLWVVANTVGRFLFDLLVQSGGDDDVVKDTP